MRKTLLLFVIVILALACAACSASPAARDKSEKEESLILPGGPGQTSDKGEQPEEKPANEEQGKSTIYPPSIFVIEVSGTYRQELAPGYYADYEVEFYADKLDELDLQTISGQYTGVFWMKITLDTTDYLKDFLKYVPVDMQFDAGGEGICDFFNVVLMNGFERHSAGGSFDIPEESGGSITPSGDTLAARGSFIAEPISSYLDAWAQGAIGETVEHHDDQGVAWKLILSSMWSPTRTTPKRNAK